MSLSPRDQKRLAGVFLLAGACVWVYHAWVLRPLVKTVAQVGQDVHTKQKQLQAFEQLLAQEPQLHQEYARLSVAIQQERAALPSDQELPVVLERIANLAGAAGVKVQTVLPQRTVLSPPTQNTPQLYKEIPIQMEGVAGFHQLGNFLSQIESGAQPMQVKTLHISGNAKDVRRHAVQVTLIGYFATGQDSPASKGGS